jgi:CubicO group peptidase (beta-lactamase class C family)
MTHEENASSGHKYLRKLADEYHFRGSVLLARNGVVLLKNGYGLADVENSIANSSTTKFPLGSLTKQFTAIATLMLQFEEKLDIGDSICDYLENCPSAWNSVTAHHLLTHSSGIPDVVFLSYKETGNLPLNPEDAISHASKRAIRFDPGTRHEYCNLGYLLLGRIIEKVSGVSYLQYLQNNIFAPLNMRNTGYSSAWLSLGDRAIGYKSNNVRADYVDMGALVGAAELHSTAEDLLLWDQALYSEILVPRDFIRLMFTPHIQTPNGDGYGYGWYIRHDNTGLIAHHRGRPNGFRIRIWRHLTNRALLIILSNLEELHIREIRDTLLSLVFNQG